MTSKFSIFVSQEKRKRGREKERGHSGDKDDSGQSSTHKHHQEKIKEGRDKHKPRELHSFLCNGPHWKVIKNKKKAIHSLTDKLSEEEPDEELGSIQLINAMAKSKGLIHVEGRNQWEEHSGHHKDVSTSHYFLSVEEAKTNGLKPNKERVCLKPVEKPVQGLTRAVELHMGDWKGKIDLTYKYNGWSLRTGNLRLTSFSRCAASILSQV